MRSPLSLIRIPLLSLLFLFLLTGSVPLKAQESDLSKLFAAQSEFLQVDEAFQISTEIVDEEIIAKFEIADEYYMYRSRFYFSADGATLDQAYIPAGKKKVDEYLGKVEVYYHNLEISIPFVAHQKEFTLIVEYQGCAEAGLCYPPEEKKLTLYADEITPISAAQAAKTSGDKVVVELPGRDELKGAAASANKTSSATKISKTDAQEFVPEQEKVVNFLSDKSLPSIIFYFVLLGIGLAFTPCVLPMVPILSSIIVGQGEKISTGKAFALSLSYTQSMAIPYTILGIVAGAAGSSLSNTLQEPQFIIATAVIFVLLSLSMFGFYELQLPQGIQNKLNGLSNSQKGGSYLGAGVMGAISALVVSPCVTVPLAGVLIYIAQTGDQLIGGVALYSLAFGMGIPLLLVGVGGHKLLPKSGAWMNTVKAVFGVVMLAVALYISKHLIPGPVYLAAWAALIIVSAVYMGALGQPATNGQKLWKGVGLMLLVYGFILILGAAMGNKRLFSPLANVGQLVAAQSTQGVQPTARQTGYIATLPDAHFGFKLVKTVEDVNKVLERAKASGYSVMFDFFAESCTACYEFADYTFPDPKVQQALRNTWLIQADVTANDEVDKALMKHFDIRGLPSILFFDAKGVEDKRFRAIGFEGAEIFAQRIEAAIGKMPPTNSQQN